MGNGKSLTPDQLDFIYQRGWSSIGMNRIYRIYDQTVWRPSMVFMADFPRNHQDELDMDVRLHQFYRYPIHVRGDLGKWIDHERLEKCKPFFACAHAYAGIDTDEWHLPSLCNAGGTAFIAMQHAVLQGYTRIILIGMDGKFTGDETTNHFVPDYLGDNDRTPEQARQDTENLQQGHTIAARECKVRGVEVINASTFTHLEQYGDHPAQLEELGATI